MSKKPTEEVFQRWRWPASLSADSAKMNEKAEVHLERKSLRGVGSSKQGIAEKQSDRDKGAAKV